MFSNLKSEAAEPYHVCVHKDVSVAQNSDIKLQWLRKNRKVFVSSLCECGNEAGHRAQHGRCIDQKARPNHFRDLER